MSEYGNMVIQKEAPVLFQAKVRPDLMQVCTPGSIYIWKIKELWQQCTGNTFGIHSLVEKGSALKRRLLKNKEGEVGLLGVDIMGLRWQP